MDHKPLQASLAERLKWARERLEPKLSQSALARAVKLTPQSIQALEAGEAKKSAHLIEIARVLGVDARWLSTGVGEPKVTTPDLSALHSPKVSTGPQAPVNVSEKDHSQSEKLYYSNVTDDRQPAPHIGLLPRDLPVRGTAVAGKEERGDFRFNGEVAYYVRRQESLIGAKDAFVVHVRGDSMSPRYEDGDPVIVHPGQPAQIGDAVLVELKPTSEGENGAAMVKILVGKTPNKLRLKQFQPFDERIEVELRRVLHIYRILPQKELIDR